MTDSQAAEEAFVRQRENCVVCRSSGMHLGNLGKRCPVGNQLMEMWFKANADEADAPRETPKRWLQSLVSREAMTRRQWACILSGCLLVVLSLLFVPTRWRGPYNPVSYSFLFTGRGTIDFARLFVEWVLIALATLGLFFSQRDSRTLAQNEQRLENPRRDWRAWRRKFAIPLIVAFALCTLALGYFGSRRIARDLPLTEVKLEGEPYLLYEQFVWEAYNGSHFVLTEVRVSISVFDEKGIPVISNRVYRVPADDFYPQQTKHLSIGVGFALKQGQWWEFVIVGAKGRPE